MLLKIVEALHLALRVVGQDKARRVGDLDRKAGLAGFFIGDAHNREASALFGLPDGLHRCHFRGLVLKRIQAVQVAGQNLQRDHHRRGVDTWLQDHFGRGAIHPFLDSVGTDTGHQKRRGQQARQHHVGKSVRERGIENNRRPALRKELPVADLIARRRMHPRVERQNPEGRQRGAEGHEESRDQMGAVGDALLTKQHDAEERRLEEKRG